MAAYRVTATDFCKPSFARLLRKAHNNACAAFIGDIGISPVQKHSEFIPEADDENEMDKQPRQPGWEPTEFKLANHRHRGGSPDGCHHALVPISEWRTSCMAGRKFQLVFDDPRNMPGHLHCGGRDTGHRFAILFKH